MNNKKKILAAVIAVTMLTSSMSSIAFAAADTADTAIVMSDAELLAEQVYFEDNFDSYTETGIAQQTGSKQSAEMGNLTLGMGARKGGGDSTLALSTDESGNKYLNIHGGRWANSSRGPVITFKSEIPAFADIADGNVLDISFSANFVSNSSMIISGVTGAVSDSADAYLSIANNSQIISGEWMNVSVSVDKQKNAVLVIKDNDGKLVSSKAFTASGDSVGSIVFYLNNSDIYIDNLKVSQRAKDSSKVIFTVKDEDDGSVIKDADVTIDRLAAKSDSNGQVEINVPAGTYSFAATKAGYELVEGSNGTIDVTADSEQDITIKKHIYVPVPETVEWTAFQSSLTAPHTNDTAESKAFAVSVADQEGIAITDADIAWSITPEDANISIANGVVTVKKGFDAGENDVKTFTVTAAVTKNDSTKEITKDIEISDALFYDSGINGSSYSEVNSAVSAVEGDTENKYIATPSTATTQTITLPEALTFTPGTASKLTFKSTQTTKIVFTFKRSIAFKDANGTAIVTLDVVNNEIGKDAAWDSSDSKLGTVLGDMTIGTWSDIELMFKTNAAGETRATIKIGDKTTDLGVTTAEGLAAIDLISEAGTDRFWLMKDIKLSEVDVNGVEIIGDANISKVAGKTTSKEYKADIFVGEEGETFTWSIDSVDGLSVTPSADKMSATVNVGSSVPDGEYTLTAVSSASADKKAEFKINVADAVVSGATVIGDENLAFEKGSVVKYSVSDVIDQFGADISKYMTPEWKTSDESVATINANGELNTLGTGAITITATIGGVDYTKDVVIGNYSVVGKADAKVKFEGVTVAKAVTAVVSYDEVTNEIKNIKIDDAAIEGGSNEVVVNANNGDKVMLWESMESAKPIQASKTADGMLPEKTTVSLESLVRNDNVKSYLVTTSLKGKQVMQEVQVPEANATTIEIDTSGADAYEVSPIFTYENVGNIPDGSGLTVAIPSGSYDFTITKASTTRADVFVNGVMIGNNVDQSDDGKGSRNITTGGTYTAEEIIVKGGKAVVTMKDKVSDMATVVVKKTPSIVERNTRVYVLGDSLVTNYYGEPTNVNDKGIPNPGNARTGWGQVLSNYFMGDINVTNLAESGNYAEGLYGGGADSSAFGGVINNAQPGDYLILECGYNDKNYSTTENMTTAVNAMIDACRAKGITPILVTPNASQHDYKESVQWASTLVACATAKDTMLIDLGKISYNFFVDKYGADAGATVGKNYQVYTSADQVDTLHSSYVGAMKFAEIVAQGIYDMQQNGTTTGKGENADNIGINTDFTFSFVDTEGNTIDMQVK